MFRRTYRHDCLDKTFQVNFVGGRGYDAFRVLFKAPNRRMSIFYYRGDSPGEGGSDFYWLWKKQLKKVLEYLEPGGLIVNDGSNAERRLRKFLNDHEIGSDAVEQSKSFDYRDRHFSCIGYAGERYGPTLIWKVD